MAIAFRSVTSAPLRDFDAAAPDGVVIGIAGGNGSGQTQLLRVAAGCERPAAGSVEVSGGVRLLGPQDDLDLSPVPVLLLDQSLARQDLAARERAATMLGRLRREGTTTLLVSHDEDLLKRLSDEIWWLREGRLEGRGDPEEMLAAYRKHVDAEIRAWGGSVSAPLAPRLRRGDGRAEVLRVDTIGEDGRPTMVWRSGELVVVRVVVNFREAVADPVVGIMIRTRIGLNVYGTNTELERVKIGPCARGERYEISFAFRCDLCPEQYTLTVASHDPDGVWHDWLEDAIAFAVSDTRYTAGVANLRATVRVAKCWVFMERPVSLWWRRLPGRSPGPRARFAPN
jgi:energy-coupling factor transporter ATP-binding protein EcfA2